MIPFISPLAPFLDPGSRAFEEPERYGYRLLPPHAGGSPPGAAGAELEVRAQLRNRMDEPGRDRGGDL